MKKSLRDLGIGTLVTHFMEGDNPLHAHVSPIFQTSTFSFPDVQTGADIFAGTNKGFSYSRVDNPNARQLASKIAVLEGIDLIRENPDTPIHELIAGKMFASGMAAITTAVMALAEAGNTIVSQKMLYGNAYNLMKKILPLYGINVVWVEGSDLESWEAAFNKNPNACLAYVETPANPTMEIVDIRGVSEIAHAKNAWVIVDNTFATPYCQRPLTLGADVVAHSTTKYLSGHGLIIGGAIVTRRPDFLDPQKTRFFMVTKVFGGSPSPFDSWLTNIGLKTFELRMQRHIENASIAANWLLDHPKVSRVFYPGLEDFEGHDLAKKQMFNGYGGMLSFELTGGYDAGVQLMQNLELITLAVSLGNVDSLIQHPASMTHAAVSSEDRMKVGITEALIRFSVGIESIEDVISDLDQGMSHVAA
ncbi:MAG: aminotransferase class I/II-fold pyridoxal phosphate-dependent enzyme [Anaerolineales bacterium]|nr:aminotransferase class I/II-fold pyridoxal phosphate-dependent enzyme [Anaerolineales bacterium]